MTRLEAIHTLDDLILKVPVTFEPGSPVTTLTGGLVQAFARDRAATVVASSVVAAGVLATVTFNAGAFTPGEWAGQVVATLGGQTQTIAEFEVMVKPSFRP